MDDNPAVKVTFTVTVEMTAEQRTAYAERYGVDFVEMEVAGRARQEVRTALANASWLQGTGTFEISKQAFGVPKTGEWHDDWEVVARDRDGNAILRHRETDGRYRILPLEDGDD